MKMIDIFQKKYFLIRPSACNAQEVFPYPLVGEVFA